MIKQNLRYALLTIGFSSMMLLGCSSVKLADIPATADPHEEVSKLDTDLNTAVTKNVDVLAADEFNKSKSYLDEAKSSIQNGEPQTESLNELRKARGYLQEAYALSQGREAQAEGLFAARQMSLNAGAGRYPELRNDLKSLDSEVSSKADRLADTKTEKLADYQKRYVDLERRAVIVSQLGKAQAQVNGGQKNKAKDKAPVSFKNAELSLKTAESMISTNVRNPDGYRDAVAQANKDAIQLMNVLSVIEQNGKNLEESVAIKMVSQNKAISNLKTDLGAAQSQGEADQAVMQNQTEELATANNKVKIQRVLEKARATFTPAEAEAYQQGTNLVIRLKQVNFATGRSDLPASSLALLAKVSDVAKSLNASHITIEGHTDSVGSASENKALSEKRAGAVATYLKTNGFEDIKIESEGYGFKKPIATNKSQAGRAQNRRVDVIITPESSVQ